MIDNFLKLHATYEKKALRILLKEFRKMSAKISFDALTKENAEAIIPFAIDNKAMQEALFKVHYTIGKSYVNLEARKLRQEVKKFKPLPLFNEAFQNFLLAYYAEFGGAEIKLLTATFITAIVEEIRKATYENETVVQMRDRIFKKVNSPNFYKWQALRIARTETTFAMNRAKLISGEVSGLTMEKYWIAKIDSRTRDQHAYMNGKKVGQNELFDVGGEKMLHPGDRLNGASGSNLVNCRCTFGYRAKRDSNGQLIWNDYNNTTPVNKYSNLHPEAQKFLNDNNIDLNESFVKLVPKNIPIKEGLKSEIVSYADGTKLITISKDSISKSGKRVFYHELGHVIDIDNLNINRKKDVRDIIEKYNKELNLLEVHNNLYNDWKIAEGIKKDEINAVADLIMSINPEYGWGHPKKYMKSHGKKELIAHAFELRYLDNATAEKYIPNLRKDLITLLDKHAK